MVSLPYRIRHYYHGLNAQNSVLIASNQTITFPEGVEGLPSGYNYGSADIFKLTATLSHNIPTGETYVNGWVRNSSCNIYDNTTSILNPYWAGVTLDNINQNNATLTGYIYKIKKIDSLGFFAGYHWLPNFLNNSTNVTFAYSVHTLDSNSSIGINKNNIDYDFKIYPNPANNQITINYTVTEPTDVFFKIYDARGNIVIEQVSKQYIGQYSQVYDLSKLSNGLYLCNLILNGHTISKPVIKQ